MELTTLTCEAVNYSNPTNAKLHCLKQDAQLSQRDHAAGCVSFGQCKSKTGRFTDYRSIFNHFDIIGQQSNRIRRKKRKIRAITPLKVIKVSTNRKLVCNCLLVINSN